VTLQNNFTSFTNVKFKSLTHLAHLKCLHINHYECKMFYYFSLLRLNNVGFKL
jgi:hypothetical protein